MSSSSNQLPATRSGGRRSSGGADGQQQQHQQYKLDGRSKRIKWETSKALIPVKPLKSGMSRPVKPAGVEHKYFETIAWSEDGARRVKCNYCPHELWANTSRMRHHIVNNCLGDVPEQVKLELTLREGDLESKKLKEIKKQVIERRSKLLGVSTNSASNSTSSGNGSTSDRGHVGLGSRKRSINNESGSEDEEMIVGVADDDDADEEKVAKLLKSLLTQSASKSSGNNDQAPSATSHRGQQAAGNEELNNLEQNLRIQKMRLEIELLKDQKKLFSKLDHSLDTITKAASLWIEQSRNNLATVYTNDGDAGHEEATYLTGSCVVDGSNQEQN